MRMPRVPAALWFCALLGACVQAPNQVAPLPPVALPPAPPPGEPPGIVGMDAVALRAAFGTPTFIRKDGEAEMWRYDGVSCKAFFFLYANAGVSTVSHVETMPRGPVIAADESCLAQLRARPAAPAT
jgi:hypothetical protein